LKGLWRTALRTVMSKAQIPIWGLPLGIAAMVGLSSGFLIWGYWAKNDLGPKRWADREPLAASDPFKDFVRPHPVNGRMTRDWRKPNVAVYSVPSTPHPRATLRDLADNGQAHAIDFLGKDQSPEQRAWKQLSDALDDTSLEERDPFEFSRVLVATVTKGTSWDPGDRMMWTRVFVQPINFNFAGYTVAATENATVKVSSVEATKTRKISTDIGLTLPSAEEGPKASVEPSSERSVKTTSDINVQYEKLGIDIVPHFLRIVRESETGGDVVGNTLLSLALKTDPSIILTKESGETHFKPVTNDDLVLLVTSTKFDGMSLDGGKNAPVINVIPQTRLPHCPLKAHVSMLYEQRDIEAGRKYYDESRQSVRYERDRDDEGDVEIVSADDVSPAIWSIKMLPNPLKTTERQTAANFLGAHVEGGVDRKLVFKDYDQASQVSHWVRTHPKTPVGSLHFNYVEGDSVVPVKNTCDECSDDEKAKECIAAYNR
jgi:hypothetical protein